MFLCYPVIAPAASLYVDEPGLAAFPLDRAWCSECFPSQEGSMHLWVHGYTANITRGFGPATGLRSLAKLANDRV